jgi:predicted nucleic acid-binding protein
MEIYLDTCSLQRPLDDRSQPKINMEAEAILTILGIVEAGFATIVSSEAIEYEISRIPDQLRKNRCREILYLAKKKLLVSKRSKDFAKEFIVVGITPLDALHLALAVEGNIEYFCTSDEKFLRKIRSLNVKNIKTMSPLELVLEVTK